MKMITILLAMVFAMAVTASAGELSDKVKAKLKGLEMSGSGQKTTSVAGIRGAEQKDDDKLYWSGKEKVSQAELESFKVAFAETEKGDKIAARKAFEGFVRSYPDSPLAKDAVDMIEELKK